MGSLNHEDANLDDSGCFEDAFMHDDGYRGSAQLLDLSDDVLLYFLKYFGPRDLKALGHVCPRLGRLVCDRTLWTKVDTRDQQFGQQRLRWLVMHCLSPSTTELKITGFVNKYSRCLGIQDLHLPGEPDQEFIRGTCVGAAEGVDVDHVMLRMWYPHLPRDIILANLQEQSYRRYQNFAVTPRWPDKKEADCKNAKSEASTSKTCKPSSSSCQSDEKPGCSGETCSKPEKGACSSCRKESGCMDSRKPDEIDDVVEINSESDDDECSSLIGEDWDKCKGPQFSLTAPLMKELKRKCSRLTSLTLEHVNIDYKMTNLQHFPPTLKNLCLRGSRCYNLPLNVSFMGKVQERLPHLEYLDVSECDWFEPASLMPLSKLAGLTELYMRHCKRITECVAYASLSTRYGFRKLKVLDLRGCPLADSEVSAAGWLPCLEELYVSPPEEHKMLPEHTHTWKDLKNDFNELDHWELKEPDYYKVKSPEPEDDDDKDETVENDKAGDVQNSPWWGAHERRIIVIQPNANRQLEERYPLADVFAAGDFAEGLPGPRIPVPRPDPAVPRNIELIQGPAEIIIAANPRQGAGDPQQRPVESRLKPPVPENPQSGPAKPRPDPSSPQEGPVNSQPESSSSQDGPANSRPDPSSLQEGPANRRADPSSSQEGPANPLPDPSSQCPASLRPNPSSSQQGPANLQPGPSSQGPANLRPDSSSSHQGPANPQPGPANGGESGTSKRRLGLGITIDVAKRRRLEQEFVAQFQNEVIEELEYESDDHYEEEFQDESDDESDNECGHCGKDLLPPINNNPDFCPRLRLRDISHMGEPGRPPHNGRGSVNYAQCLDPNIEAESVDPNIEPAGPEQPEIEPAQRSIVKAEPVQPRIKEEPPAQPQRPRRRIGIHPFMRPTNNRNRRSTGNDSLPANQLVTDSAILRFGRAENENVNYVHIGRNGANGADSGHRPDISNLRILSVTGYRNITDRSLEHLVTAAPYLVHIDFSRTSITARGVELFNLLRPDCEVSFSVIVD